MAKLRGRYVYSCQRAAGCHVPCSPAKQFLVVLVARRCENLAVYNERIMSLAHVLGASSQIWASGAQIPLTTGGIGLLGTKPSEEAMTD